MNINKNNYPSVHPVATPSFNIPIIVDSKAATSNIYNIVSPKHSLIRSQRVVRSFSTGIFGP